MSKFTFGSYNIRPTPENKFKTNEVKALIKYTLNEKLKSKEYEERETTVLAKYLTDLLLQKLKGLNLEKYKYIVSTIIGEQRGQGIRVSSKCQWDSDTDFQISESVLTDSLICCTTVYAIYHY